MRPRFRALRRITALSTAMALVAATVASAQTPASAAPGGATANTTLLSAERFARLAGSPSPARNAVTVPPERPRVELLRQSDAEAARAASTAFAKTPRQGSGWGMKTAGILLAVGLIAGVLAISYYTGIDSDTLMDGLFGGR